MITRSQFGRLVGSLAALLVGTSASAAHAHICMESPKPRACDFAQQKQGPCGSRAGRSPSNVTTFRPGETITVRINESINHPSHYRIAFNPDGDKFEDPTSREDKDGKHPFVLLDNITDESAAAQSVQVTLPNVTCDNCTLQLIQVMYDKGGNGFAGNDGVGAKGDDLYYACADIVLKGAPVAGAVGDAGAPSSGQAIDAGAPVAVPSTDAGPAVKAPAADGGPLASVENLAGDAYDRDGEPEAEAGGCALTSRSDSAGAALLLLGLGTLVARARRRR